MVFKTMPAFIICGIRKCPLAKTIAFGGVDIGNIKAQLAAIVAGTTSSSGFSPRPTTATLARIDKKAAAVAVLLASSVMLTRLR